MNLNVYAELSLFITATRCYMGMKFGDIPDSAITASSQVDVKHSPARARLDTEMTGDNFRGGWAASTPGVYFTFYAEFVARYISVGKFAVSYIKSR